MENKEAFSIRDEIGTCPYFEVRLQLRDNKPFFVHPYNVREDLDNLFKVLVKYGLKISLHKCQLFRNELVYMGLQFIVKDSVAHYTAMKEKCDAIRNMQTPKSVKECRTFCGMVKFLSTFCNLRELLTPIYDLTKKRA